jgi:vancomycin permeability regulator SanA
MKKITKLLGPFVLLCLLFFFFLFFSIAFFPAAHDIEKESYLGVAFGAGITIAGEPSLALKYRLDKSLALYKEKKIVKIFVSGKPPETFVMKSYLIKNNVLTNDIIEDPKGENTLETVENVRDFILTNHVTNGIVFISQRYHIPRIILLSWKKNLHNVSFLASDAKKIKTEERILFIIREGFAFLKSAFLDY